MAAAPVSPVAPTPQPEAATLSQGARIIDTFIAPSKTFTDLRRSAAWWAPWLVISLFTLVLMFVIGKQVGFEQITRHNIEHSSRSDQFDKLSPADQNKQIQTISKFTAVGVYAAPVLILLYCLIATVALWITFKLVAGGETSFGQAYATVMYAWLPGIIGAVLGVISLFAGVNPEGFDINNPVGTNLGYYLDAETTNKFVRAMASSLDVLTIWSLILIGIGFSCTSKVKRGTSITIVVVWYLVYKVAASALMAR